MALLEVRSVSKAYGSARVLRDVSFAVPEGEIVCMLGPSGCGKTTLLRIIAGLEAADAGLVRFDDQDLDDIPVHQRGFGLMFQDFALFPHKDVAANVAFGLRMQAVSRQQVAEQVSEMLDLVGLAGYEQRRVFELSGGEQQRVAVSRALASKPAFVLADEPTANLDSETAESLLDLMEDLNKNHEMTFIFSTHDARVMNRARRIITLRDGAVAEDERRQ
jgi:thiamine transport system ATP-binding protein